MELVKGIAEDEIVKYSRVYLPLIIILGPRGADRKSNDLIGSVTAEVMERASVPVLAIPEDFRYDGLGGFKKVLYATDFSESDFISIDKLEQLMRPLGVKIICVHVSSKDHSKWDEVKLAGLREHIKTKYNEDKVECDIIENEDLYVGIESFVRENDINVLSFTRKKRNIIGRIVNPNIARKMLFHSTTPLLVFND